VVDEEAGGKETDSTINVSFDWVNRINYIPRTCWVRKPVCEISNLMMNFKSTGVGAHQPNIHQSNRKWSLRTNRRPSKMRERFKSKWMARRSSIQITPVQYWEVCHSKWWLIKFFADHLDILNMYAEMGNDERTEMQLKFQISPNPSVFVTTPKVGWTGLHLTAANHAVITQKFWVLNEQR